MKIKIEFFHDVICSFCFPMSYRMRELKKVMPNIEIIHRSFALIKKESDFETMFGSRENAKNEILSHWAQANKNDDLHRFNIEGMRNETFLFPASMNPLRACKAAYYVADNEGYWDLFDALQTSLFVKNQNIELEEVIFDSVKLIGLDFEKWQEYFNSDKVTVALESEFELARKYGLQGVPALVINNESIIKGAVSLEQIVKTIEEFESKKMTILASEDTCETDGTR